MAVMRDCLARLAATALLSGAAMKGPATPTAEAAVRSCGPFIISDVGHGATLIEAKRMALSSWVHKAKAAGVDHPAWRIAYRKNWTCSVAAGRHVCVAEGEPCVIHHKRPKPEKLSRET